MEILESNIHQTLCGLYACINIKLIDEELLQMLNAENNTEKTLRRHNFKLKNSKFDKSKFFHKDNYERRKNN